MTMKTTFAVAMLLVMSLTGYAQSNTHGTYTATVTSGTAYSSEVTVPTRGCVPGGLVLDSWTGTSVTFQIKVGSTWYDVYDSYGTLLTVTVGENRAVVLELPNLYTFKVFRVRSGIPSLLVTQADNRTLVFSCR